MNSVLPRKPLLSSFTARLQSKIPKIHMASNPCRLKFFGQEIVVFRDDVMSRMLRNLVGVKPDARNEDLKRYVRAAPDPMFHHRPIVGGCLLFLSFFFETLRQLVQSILDQSHLTPSTTYIQPVLPEYDHAMRLYPLPTCVRVTPTPFPSLFLPFHTLRDAGRQVVLADKYDSYRMTYEGCHVFNPGRFLGRSLGFSTYTPASRESEAWYVIYYPSPPPPFSFYRSCVRCSKAAYFWHLITSVIDLEAEN